MPKSRDEASGRVVGPRTATKLKPAAEDRERKRITDLERLVARQALEMIFQRCLAAHRGNSPETRVDFRYGVYRQIRQVDEQQGELTVERMCTLAVSRASYYRHCGPPETLYCDIGDLWDTDQLTERADLSCGSDLSSLPSAVNEATALNGEEIEIELERNA